MFIFPVKAESQDTCITSQDAVENAQKMKRNLLEELEELAEDLPPNTLDELIDELGGPENVAEVCKTFMWNACVALSVFSLYFLKTQRLNVSSLYLDLLFDYIADDWPQRSRGQQ